MVINLTNKPCQERKAGLEKITTVSQVLMRMLARQILTKLTKNYQISGTRTNTKLIANRPSQNSMILLRPIKFSPITTGGLTMMMLPTRNTQTLTPRKPSNAFMKSMDFKMTARRSSSISTTPTGREATTKYQVSPKTPLQRKLKPHTGNQLYSTTPKTMETQLKPEGNLMKLMRHTMLYRLRQEEETMMTSSSARLHPSGPTISSKISGGTD